jgi:signal transduction histidine kinase
MSVRARFTITVAAIIAVTVALFATLSIIAIDRALRSSLDTRLHSAAQTVATTVDVHQGRISVDAGDLESLASIHAEVPFAVYDPGGRQVAGDELPTSPRSHGLHTTSIPVMNDGRVVGSVTVWQSDVWISDFVRDAVIVSLGIGALLIVLGAIISRRVAESVLAPLARIASLAERIEGRDLSGRLDADGNDELGRLCASFDRMLDRLQAAFGRERRFVADASHELRAPLAVLRSETDLALRRPRSNIEYRDALVSIAREAVRLEELVDELLAAARAEVDARQQQPLDPGDLMRRLGERVRPAAATRGMEVRVEASDVGLAQGNLATLERALLAIVHNAIAYGRDDGIVRLRAIRDDDAVSLQIADDGPGFTPEALAHATERFWRGDSAHPRGGTGLGLAIARTMVEANRGSLHLANGVDGGAVVTIKLAAVAPEFT